MTLEGALRRKPMLPKRQVLADGVYETLMALLMEGSFAPGDAVSIDSLSRELAVSPTPIREALARIEASGLIVREPLRGYRIAPPMSPEAFKELMDARLLIEPHNAATAASRSSALLLDELSEALSAMRAAPKGPTYQESRRFLSADAAFHAAIGRHSGNRYLAEAVSRLGSHQHRFRLFRGSGISNPVRSLSEHRDVFAAIKQGDSAGARDAMRTHLLNVLDRALNKATSE